MKRRCIVISFTIEEVEAILAWMEVYENEIPADIQDHDLRKRFEEAKKAALRRSEEHK